MTTNRKPRLPKGAKYLNNGPVSTVFEWHGQMFRFAQNRRGGIIYRAKAKGGLKKMILRAFHKRHQKRVGGI